MTFYKEAEFALKSSMESMLRRWTPQGESPPCPAAWRAVMDCPKYYDDGGERVLFLHGDPQSGKTHCALSKLWSDRQWADVDTDILDPPDVATDYALWDSQELQRAAARQDGIVDAVASAWCVLIDDVGHTSSPGYLSVLKRILDGFNGDRLIVTSNFSLRELLRIWSDRGMRVLGEAVTLRLERECAVVRFAREVTP